ncbi:cytochrome c oxidase assembly protein subunit 15 [Pseudooceanicola nitratireducens]|uniref:Heme A synthase n=1 Tax=Pseudooceanicola nitratireducens TaxID=517719 RepID=A0A1I1LKC6_9RHOB|nr:heme A synthase [Pseudooceanicola nitratireducens]SEJ63701.1 cytochrome c oxidase assembly protein subunit 15 [Pseudooceanicola nitratireducens]SFC73406.1 cytochrome c oxidase assembly protein subunit 15 [Pseudooceanicola nitratireducens]
MSEKRKLFVEVQTDQRPQIATGAIDRAKRGARGAIRVWLMLLFALVVVMIAVGGLTRLTDSGLSITEWKPLTGAMPPMNAADWQAEFDKYQQIPEFKVQNAWMTLEDFKSIYWWEWGHRQLGRVIGLVWALGFFGFLALRKIPTGWTGRLLLIGGLGGLQGAIGWWMVSSGLTGTMLDVASYRLATHLGLAFVILGFIAWYILMLGREERDLMQARRSKDAKLFSLGTGWMHFAFLQILIGALVAGIDAGRSYTDWPTMGGQFLPPDPMMLEPAWRNFLENPGLVQFIHRMTGYLLLGFSIMIFVKSRKAANRVTSGAFMVAFIALCGQVVLGIYTVISAAQMHVALTHQILAVATFVLILRARFHAAYPVPQSVRG